MKGIQLRGSLLTFLTEDLQPSACTHDAVYSAPYENPDCFHETYQRTSKVDLCFSFF